MQRDANCAAPGALRPGEIAVEAGPATDAGLRFIGLIRTPWASRADCPRQGDMHAGLECRIALDSPWDAGLAGVEAFATLDVLYWLDEARRDLVVQAPRHADGPRGTFALRSPERPNPIGLSRVTLIRREGATLVVRGLDCRDSTPLIDVKPDRCAHSRAE